MPISVIRGFAQRQGHYSSIMAVPHHGRKHAAGDSLTEQEPCQRWRWTLLLAFALALGTTGLLLAHFHDHSWYAPDEGAYADIAARLLDGQVLHREVGDLHAGTVNFINAGAFRMWGRSLLSLRYALVVAGLAQAVVVFLLLWRGGRGSPLVAAVGTVATTALGVLQFLDPTAHWYCLLLFFLTAWVVTRTERAGFWGGWLWLLGFLVGSQFLLRQLSGVLLAMGVTAWLLWRSPGSGAPDVASGVPAPISGRCLMSRGIFAVMALGLTVYLLRWPHPVGIALLGIWPLALLVLGLVRTRVPDRAALRVLAGLGGGAVLSAVPLLLYHLHHGTFGGWFEDAVLGALSQSRSAFIAERSFLPLIAGGAEGLLLGRDAWERLNGLFWLVLPLLGALLGALVLHAVVREGAGAREGAGPRRGSDRALDVLPFLALFHALVSLHHQIPIYLFFGLPATLAGLLWVGGGWLRGVHSRPRRIAGAVLVGTLAWLTTVALAFHAGQPWSRPWGDLLAGRKSALVEAEGIPRCGLRIPPREREHYLRLLALIEAEALPGEPIFALPMQPELYFLSGRPNPTRFFNFAFAVRGEEAAEEVLRTLAAAEPALVFYNPADKYTTAEVKAFAARLQSAEGLPGKPALRYEPWRVEGELEVLRRRRADQR